MEVWPSWYRISAKALMYNDAWQFLLAKDNDWFWDFPGGWLDHGEDTFACLTREIQEEMWLEVSHIHPQVSCFLTAHKPYSKTRPWIANVFYEVEVKNFDFTPSEECVEIWFFDDTNISHIKLLPNVKKIMENFWEKE